MKVLLDSQIIIWSIYDPQRLPSRIATILGDDKVVLFVSDASLREVSMKISKGRLEYESNLEDFYRLLETLQSTQLAISRSHIERSSSLPIIHGDPFDRMLVAQAQVEGLTLVSVDADIQRYDVPVIS